MKKGVWFGILMMALVVIGLFLLMPPLDKIQNGHLGLLMLALIVVTIMLGFPTAFTLMGMGTMFAWFAYNSVNPDLAVQQTLDLMVQRAFWVMNNDVLIAVPLFIFMGYLVERAQLVEALFKGLHLATTRIPGSLAVATIATCAIFATASGIIGAVVTLMGLLAFPAMLKVGYNVRLAAGSVCAGGTLGILIPPSVLLILYGATAGVSVMQLYAGAFFPGIMLAGLYVAYVVGYAVLKPSAAPPLSEEDRYVPLPPWAERVSKTRSHNALVGLFGALKGDSDPAVPRRMVFNHLIITLLPVIAVAIIMVPTYFMVTAPVVVDTSGLQELGSPDLIEEEGDAGGLAEPPVESKLTEPSATEAPAASPSPVETVEAATPAETAEAQRLPVPRAYWITLGIFVAALLIFYAVFNFTRLEIFKMLLKSFFPLAILILGVLGSIIAGLATPTEAAAMGSFGGMFLAIAYGKFNLAMLKESVFLTAKTTAMVCWLFVGSGIFAGAFALLGGQEIIDAWVKSLDMTPTQFMIMAQVIIFLLGWPLEWTEIIIIFLPIFLPLLSHFNVDPLFFGLLVALNLQTAFLSPPVAMSAFYLKGVSPPHVSLNQIFLGMMPFMAIQIIAIVLLYMFPAIGLWLPSLVYGH